MMSKKRYVLLLLIGLFVARSVVVGQFGMVSPNYGRTNTGVIGVTIGNIATPPTPNIGFQVRGDLLGTGEVFRTDAPLGDDTYWRMFYNGGQYFNIYKLSSGSQVNINAQLGHLLFRTNDLPRLRLNPTGSYGIGAFGAAPRDGFLLLSGKADAYTNTGSHAPFTRLHLVDDTGSNSPIAYAQELGYRPWMRNGITFSGNSDQAYVGHKYFDQPNGSPVDDNTDFVIQWSDNPNGSPWGTDRMKFVFSTTYVAGTVKGAASFNGLEAMRLWPSSATTVNVGIGDFAAPGSGDPTERLDLLTGRLRLRDLPVSTADNTLTKIMAVDNTGVVKWRDVSTIVPPGCEWQLWPVTNNVVTAFAGNLLCPDINEFKGVGIGNTGPKAKLDVFYTGSTGGGSTLDGITAFSSWVQKGTGSGKAIVATAKPAMTNQFTTGTMYGTQSSASNANFAYGVEGNAGNNSSSPGTSTDLMGVRGLATASNNAVRCVGVYGTATGAQAGNNWAAYFDGPAFCTAGAWTPSDETLKLDIQEVQDASAILAQLTPRSYVFNTGTYGFMGFDTGRHFGLLAQELAEAVPSAVTAVTRPADVDSLGAEVNPAVSFKAVNYQELIPLLIASNNEQQARLEAQEARLHQLEQQLAACCTAGGTRSTPQEAPTSAAPAGDALRIAPNPFQDRTTLTYTVPAAGQLKLEVGTADGRPLKTLRQEEAQAGTFTYEWNTQGLAPGTYLVSLLLDGRVVVKKAVKVDR